MADITEKEYLANYNRKDFDSPLTTVDTAVFTIIDNELMCLLVKRGDHPAKGQWSIPGGIINMDGDEDIEACARRKLLTKTGVKTPYLEQVKSVGNAVRDPRGWSMTVLYFALIDRQSINVSADNVEDAHWVTVAEAQNEKLAFDHNQLLTDAVERLRSRSTYTALPISLLPELFTLSELQNVFEIVLGASLEKKSFRRRVETGGAVVNTNTKRGGHYPAALYKAGQHSRDFAFPRPLEPHKERSKKE